MERLLYVLVFAAVFNLLRRPFKLVFAPQCFFFRPSTVFALRNFERCLSFRRAFSVQMSSCFSKLFLEPLRLFVFLFLFVCFFLSEMLTLWSLFLPIALQSFLQSLQTGPALYGVLNRSMKFPLKRKKKRNFVRIGWLPRKKGHVLWPQK